MNIQWTKECISFMSVTCSSIQCSFNENECVVLPGIFSSSCFIFMFNFVKIALRCRFIYILWPTVNLLYFMIFNARERKKANAPWHFSRMKNNENWIFQEMWVWILSVHFVKKIKTLCEQVASPSTQRQRQRRRTWKIDAKRKNNAACQTHTHTHNITKKRWKFSWICVP